LGTQCPRGVEQGTVDVELVLAPRVVADTNWSTVLPSAQVLQLSLVQVSFAADAEHDLQVLAPLELSAGRAREEVEKRTGLVRACRNEQTLEGHAGVAHPGEAVVPGAAGAHPLGQAGSGRRHHGAAAGVGQAAQDPPAVSHQIPPRPVVRLVQARPAPPRRLGAAQPPTDPTRAPRPGRRAPGVDLLYGEGDVLPGVEGDLRGRPPGAEMQRPIGAEDGHRRAAVADHSSRDPAQPRMDQAELWPRDELDVDPDRPLETTGPAEQHTR